MIKYSTPVDLLRYLRDEETEEESLYDRTDPDMMESLAILKEMLDKLFAEPGEDCIRKISEYSRSLNLR